ncbi:hypothetical protein EDB81DRAFT_885764 [Dactylonectria macrodidyma]|uniref:Uncharacterized protein n=1 Tax=Dactylonectria macrodidyma TaxID=307937 RepID=A0A9P9EPQ7_9HYPO|nr:hypothetical protein EDB81DRAFT_885764 [Dactylonectria macrodidyma]
MPVSKRSQAQRRRRARERVEAQARAERLGRNEPTPEPPTPPRRNSADLNLARDQDPGDRPEGRRNSPEENQARAPIPRDRRRYRQDFLACIPQELNNVIIQEAVPRGSMIVATVSPDIDIEDMPRTGNGYQPLWIRYAMHSVQRPIWGQDLQAIEPMTMQGAMNPLLGATAAHSELRGRLHAAVGGNSNLFVFTNSYSCWAWVKEYGKTYIPLMRQIYIIFIDSQERPQIWPPYLHDETEAVWSEGNLPNWQMGTATTDGNYLDQNLNDVPNANIKPAAIANALLQAGAKPDQLAFAYITEYVPDGSNFNETVYAQLAKPLRTRHQRHDFRLAMSALRRIPTPNPLKFIYKPSVELTEADAAAGWGNFYDCLVRHHEAYEVANLTNKTVQAYLLADNMNHHNTFELICTAERRPPRRSRRARGVQPGHPACPQYAIT